MLYSDSAQVVKYNDHRAPIYNVTHRKGQKLSRTHFYPAVMTNTHTLYFSNIWNMDWTLGNHKYQRYELWIFENELTVQTKPIDL